MSTLLFLLGFGGLALAFTEHPKAALAAGAGAGAMFVAYVL